MNQITRHWGNRTENAPIAALIGAAIDYGSNYRSMMRNPVSEMDVLQHENAIIQQQMTGMLETIRETTVQLPWLCAPSENELAKAVTSGWVEGFDEFGKYGHQFDSALAARAVLALFGDQPTVTQAKADALRETTVQLPWLDSE